MVAETLRIAMIAPLYESVPPRLYGGTERVVSYLTEELVRQGHDVTLFASGDSVTAARLRPGTAVALRLGMGGADAAVAQLAHMMMVQDALDEAGEFDVIHLNIDHLHLPLFAGRRVAAVSTLHGRLDLPLLPKIYARYADMPLVSISEAQRRPLPLAHWIATVHHGLPVDLHPYQATAAGYLAFVGRASPEKRLDRAIRIARRAGWPLKIAAKVDRADQAYFEAVIRPMLDGPDVEFIGEVGEHDKAELLGGAAATLFPIDWPEPFGLVMIESMACGTPVIAFRGGSVEEVVDEGVSGFVVDDEEQAVDAVAKLPGLDRAACRRSFEQRFSAERMASDYVAVYRRIGERPSRRSRAEPTQYVTP